MKKTLTTFAALALIAGFALAQPQAGCPMAQAGDAPKMMKMEKVQKMAMPEMTAEQLDKMDALRTSHIKEMAPLRTDLKIKEMELAALWRAEKLDAKKIVAKVKEISDVRGKLELARVNHRLDMYNLMTPEQRKMMKPGMMGRCGMGGMQGMGRGMGMGRKMMRRVMIQDDGDGQMGMNCPMGGGMMGGCQGDCGMQ